MDSHTSTGGTFNGWAEERANGVPSSSGQRVRPVATYHTGQTKLDADVPGCEFLELEV